MNLVRWACLLLGLCLLPLLWVSARSQPAAELSQSAGAASRPNSKPRLVVAIVVDQLRADYLDRYDDLFLPAGSSNAEAGGFRFLRERGARFTDARYRHFPLFTGPGHAVVLTGGYPYKTGIVGNDWYSKADKAQVYCVQDLKARVVGDEPSPGLVPMSPANLRSTTVGDELKMATGGAARVVTLSLKDRAAILLGGRLADASLWFDDASGRWVSSSAYCPTGHLPKWASEINARKIPDSHLQTKWSLSLPPAALERLWRPAGAGLHEAPHGMRAEFPHKIPSYKAFTLTPHANAFVLETAKAAVKGSALGQDETPDVLAFNLATNDYVGHAFGTQSPETLDVTVQTDHQLSDFFRFLDQTIPGGLDAVTIVLTADHGAAPVPEEMQLAGFPAGRILSMDIEARAEAALDARLGPRDWVARYVEPSLYLNDAALAASKRDPEEAQRVAARAVAQIAGVYDAYTRAQVHEGRVGQTDLAARLARGFYPRLSGDVLVVSEQGWFSEEKPRHIATTHGSPYAYDTHVPLLLAGFGVRPGTYHQSVCPADIAPTLSALLGTALPSGCDGHPLQPALR